MRIVKSFPIQDSKTERASKVFDSVITVLDYPWRFDRLELHIRDENKVVVKDSTCIIVLDYNDIFIQETDSKGIAILMLRAFFKAMTQLAYGKLPEIIEDVIANREMIKRGYGDALVYYYYQKNLVWRGVEKEVGWLSFYLDDKYNSELLKGRQTRTAETQRLLDCLTKDLEDKMNLGTALRVYYTVGGMG